MATGSTKLQLPIAKPVGSQYQATSATPGQARPQVAIPPPSPIVINGKAVIIDVRSMSGSDVVNALNTIPGVTASINGQGQLVVIGARDIFGDTNLREILGI